MTNQSHVSTLMHIRSILQNSVSVSMSSASGFFKTGAGHYAEHDIFIGVTVPCLRKIAQQFADLSLDDLQELITSKINEERLLALLILIAQYKKATSEHKEEIYQFYLKNLNHVNNWNLVDASAHWIMGAHLWERDRSILLVLAQSECLWRRRIAIVATWYFIRKNDLTWTFDIARVLLDDKHDLIHKAVGWMLREAGKSDGQALMDFVDCNVLKMPRTMLRYSIEKFPEQQRKKILALK
ncbi:DNA alkylation repair protein [bacterium]|nr:MAG: DNA alkylation repair protein [bacterium]